jgi:myo-inositol-1(or 4)-monophosphatase
MDLELYKSFALDLAEASGAVITKYYGSPTLQIDRKLDHSPVTVADREAEAVMRDLIAYTFPNHGIIGEEYGSHNESAEFVWTLDPIDGTISFATPVPLFGTLIALSYQGEPILGLIHQPILKQICMGDGKQTTLNGNPVQVRNTASQLADAFVMSTYVSEIWRYRNEQDGNNFLKLLHQVQSFRTWGDAYGYLMLASGWVDAMIDPKMNPWDLAPLKPIIEGAGGCITDWHGNNIVGATSCVAASKALHPLILQQLNEKD